MSWVFNSIFLPFLTTVNFTSFPAIILVNAVSVSNPVTPSWACSPNAFGPELQVELPH